MPKATRLVAVAVAALVALTACTSNSADPGTTSTTVAPNVSDAGPSTVSPSSAPQASSSSSLVKPTPSVADPTTANPWPADLTPEQVADAQAALAVYQESWRVSDEAYSDPTQDWEPIVRLSIADPYAALMLSGLKSLSENQLHTTGSNRVEAVVTGVTGSGSGAKVSVKACVDSSDTDLLDVNGKSVKAALPVGNRIQQTAVIYKFSEEDGGWLLTEANASDPYQPC